MCDEAILQSTERFSEINYLKKSAIIAYTY